MIRITAEANEREIVAALHQMGRDRVKRFIRLLLLYRDDPILLEECADMVLAELERRAEANSR